MGSINAPYRLRSEKMSRLKGSATKRGSLVNKTKIILAIGLVLVLLMFLTACTGTTLVSKKQREEGIATARAHIGTRGLDMNFVQGAPPDRIYETNTLSFVLELRNRGAWQLGAGSGRIYLTGFDQNIIQMPMSSSGIAIPFLEARTQFNPDGGYDTVAFESIRISLPEGLDVYKPRFILTACYNYVTEATPIVCVDPDPYSPSEQKACIPASVLGTSGQGAPVAISNVIVEPMPGRVQFKIDIINVGGGRVVDISQCPFDLQYQSINQVSVDLVSLGERAGNCKPAGKLRLVNNKATLYCDFDVSDKTSAYTTPLNVRLSYGYMDSISRDIEIRSIT